MTTEQQFETEQAASHGLGVLAWRSIRRRSRAPDWTPPRKAPGASALQRLALVAWLALAPLHAAQPVIYGTDLFHPHEDPDDHFDLAALYALPGIEVKGIVLDQGAAQQQRPGRVPVGQLNRLTGRSTPAVLGLGTPLKSPSDTGSDQNSELQQGVRFILDTIEKSATPVTLVTVGSTRDVVAAFNRQPDLLRRKVAKVLCFIGEASNPDFREYNVGLDPNAFVGLMRSGLPIYWVPCFDGGLWQNHGRASFWQARHRDLLRQAPAGLQQYFIYALEKDTVEPIGFLTQPVDPARRDKLFAQTRNLWCTAVFAVLTDKTVAFDPANGARLVDVSPGAGVAPPAGALFTFEDVDLTITDQAVIRYESTPRSKRVRCFRLLDREHYAEGMTAATARLLRDFPALSDGRPIPVDR